MRRAVPPFVLCLAVLFWPPDSAAQDFRSLPEATQKIYRAGAPHC